MMKCTIYAPWFGPLPSYASLFLASCAKSTNIQWVVHTDQDLAQYQLSVPGNVMVIPTTNLAARLSSTFTPFQVPEYTNFSKLTDFKPYWHLIFHEPSIDVTEFRGWCDWDVVHDLSTLTYEFTVAKFTCGPMASPLIIMAKETVLPQYNSILFQRMLSCKVPTGYDEFACVDLLDATVLQNALTPGMDTMAGKLPYAIHLGQYKNDQTMVTKLLTKFFPGGLL